MANQAARISARRTRQFLRVLLVFVIGLLFLAGALEGWRGTHLIGLPDIADPFDLAAFRSLRIPRDQDAFVLFRQAEQKLTRMPGLPSAVLRLGPVVNWPKVAPELRDWLMANRSVLESFKDAAERPDGIVHPGFGEEVQFHYVNIGEFAWLALLDASRLEDHGDMAGSWSCYRALFRMKVHVMRRGSLFQRYVTDRNLSALEQRLTAWAADRRTGVPLIRQALDVVLAGEPKPEWDAFSLRIEYIEKMHLLGQEWGWVQQGEDADQNVRIFGEDLPPNMAWIPYAAKRYVSAEPERSRRVTAPGLCELAGSRRRQRHGSPEAGGSGKVAQSESGRERVLLSGERTSSGLRKAVGAARPGEMVHRFA